MLIEPVPFHVLGDVDLAHRVTKTLADHYPDHPWKVFVDSEISGGVVNIYNPAHSHRYGYVLHLTTLYADPDLKCVIRAGGEMLERANIARGRYNENDPITHIDGLKDKEQPVDGILLV